MSELDTKALEAINGIIQMLDIPKGSPVTVDTPLVMKKVDDEQQRILGVVLEPDTFDLHKDIYSASEVELACKCFGEQCMNANLQHVVNIASDACVIEKSFIQNVDCMIGEQVVKAGTWLQQWKINDPDIWDLVKSGDFTGFSVGCVAKYEDID